MSDHEIESMWVPICSVCGKAIYLDERDRWKHEAEK